jgi:rhamnulokinase
MAKSTHLAIDLGAESGRAVLGTFDGEKLEVSEIHRFPTGILNLSDKRFWNIYRFYEEILFALSASEKILEIPLTSIGIDTWGVDYGLFDSNGNLMGLPFSYRDSRTQNVLDDFAKSMDLRHVYNLTGVQLLPFNTLFQLFASKTKTPDFLTRCKDLLFVPDMLNYWLTGIKTTEFTFATTSQLFNPLKGTWESELLEKIGVSPAIMQQIIPPCTTIAPLRSELANDGNLSKTLVVAPATHDTASAIAAIPATGSNWAYISTGTWALVGIETKNPVINNLTFRYNITNEGGIEGFRLLKNMMGLWLLQGCRKAWGEKDYTYEMMMLMANDAPQFSFFINPDHAGFFNPTSMPAAIEEYCRNRGQQPPQTKAAMIRGILECLALKTRMILDQIAEAVAIGINKIYITGGGIQNTLLCQFIANATGMQVISTFTESTAMGNILGQMIACGNIKNLEEGRALLRRNLNPTIYNPEKQHEWFVAYENFKNFEK